MYFILSFVYVCRYSSGDRLKPEHERTIRERLLPHHPEYEKKIGCGVDYITVVLFFAIQHLDFIQMYIIAPRFLKIILMFLVICRCNNLFDT